MPMEASALERFGDGIEQGIEQDIEQGIEQAEKTIILNMLKVKLPNEIIAKCANFDIAVVKKIALKNKILQ